MSEIIEETTVQSQDHWSEKDGTRLFLREKYMGDPADCKGIILFVHGSSMASTPTFDLQVEGRPNSSAMEYFARLGYNTWCVDMEGYGRSTKDRSNNSDIATGARNCAQAAEYIASVRGNTPLHLYGISSGALRAALFAQNHPDRVGRLALDAFVYTGKGSPTLADRTKKLPQFKAINTLLGNLKTAIGGTYHAFDFAKYAHRYLAEFQYRFNRRFDMRAVFTRLLAALVAVPASPEHRLRLAEAHR